MKKLIALIVIVCLAFSFAAGCGSVENSDEAASPTTEAPAQETTGAVETSSMDYDALRALHADDEVVATVNGREVTWGEYYGWLYMNTRQIENYFSQVEIYYGMSIGWGDSMDDSGTTYAQYAVQSTEDTLRQFAAIDAFAEKNEIELDETTLAARLDEQKKSDTTSICGEDGTEEDLVEALGEMNLTMDDYELMTLANIKYQENFKALYGEDSELVSDEDALSYLKENGYMSANHILIMTKDPSTGEELSDSDKADKKAKADEIYNELAAITDQSELMKRFSELKEEYCEDTGKTTYPDGYTFTEGQMVTEFEDAVKALNAYELSEPVQSDYGYHIILRLPDDPDSVIDYSSQDTPMTARKYWANADYAERMNAVLDETTFEYVPGFAQIELADFVK